MTDVSAAPNHPTHPDINLTDGPFYGNDPHELFTWMRANAPVYFDENSGVWGITRYADLKTISADPKTFSNAGGIRPDSGPLPMMIDMHDPDHWNRRKLVKNDETITVGHDLTVRHHDDPGDSFLGLSRLPIKSVIDIDLLGTYKVPGFGKDVDPNEVEVSCDKQGYKQLRVVRRSTPSHLSVDK